MNLIQSFFISTAAFAVAHVALPQSAPLWENTPVPSISETVTTPASEADETPETTDPLMLSASGSLSVPETIDAEIIALAEALDNDPLSIYNYVHDNIRYEHYYGIKKGAALTLLEGSANDMDQCVLLAELLEAADLADDTISLDIEYRRGRHRMSVAGGGGINALNYLGLATVPFPGKTFEDIYGSRPAGWEGLTDLQAKQVIHALNFISSRGTPGAQPWTGLTSIVFYRTWLRVTVNGNPYELDPSFKLEEEISGVDLLADTNYSRAALLSAAGGSTGTGYVQNLNDSGTKNYLSSITDSMLSALNSNYPNLSVLEIISGRRIISRKAESLDNAYEIKDVYTDRINESNITSSLNNYKTKVKFNVGGINTTINTADLNGRKITLTFNGNTAELRLDDAAPIDTANVTTETFNMTITVIHPGSGSIGSKAETKQYKKNDAFAYTILYGFSPSGRLLQKRHEQLTQYLKEGKDDDSREVRTELLNIMGLSWLYQTRLTYEVLASSNGISYMHQHRFGRMSQEEGFYVDVGLQLNGARARDGIEDDGSHDNLFQLGALYASAMEHGIIEQLQPDASAVSTVNIIRQVVRRTQDNGDGKKVYLADSSNWSSIQSQLTNYNEKNGSHDRFEPYTDSNSNGRYDFGEPFIDKTQKENFELMISQGGARIFLPADNSVTPKLPDGTSGNWSGSGWVIRSSTGAGMIISGGYSGGYSFWSGGGSNYVSSPSISTYGYSNPSYTYSAPSMPSLKPLPSLPTLPKMYGSDPVDMATGAFVYANVDLDTGTEDAPLGLNFSRHYSSNARNRDNQHLGHGWSHPTHIRAAVRTATEEALGLGTIEHVAALLTSTLVGGDLYRDDASPKEWGVAALTVGWFVDQMTDNAVSVTIGPDTFQFIRQPDGTYSPPAGSTMELTEVGGNYRLKQRLGNVLQFEPTEDADDEGQRIHKIIDPDDKEMVFHYHSDDRLDYIEDAFGRSYTFGYDSEDRIERITDSTGRDVRYRYDSHGNLDRFTDPEDKHFYFVYEAAADPDGTTPADPSLTEAGEHRIVRMRNHDKEMVTQNVWDPLGRVEAQYLHGDTAQTWTMRYTGRVNYEEDPEGGVTAYLYDDRGRSAGKIDAEGNQMTRRYDGQDRVIERISGTDEVTSYQYDAFHNLLQIDYSGGGGSTVNEYDALHRLKKTTDPENNVTELFYFSSGFNAHKNRPQYLIDPAGTTTFTYFESGAGAGMVQTITDEDSLVTENAYDAYGQPAWTDAPGGLRTIFTHNARGDLDLLEDPNGIQTDYTYNDRRQVTQIISDLGGADEATEDRFYDNQGRLERTLAAPHDGGQRVEERFTYNPTDLPEAEFLTNETASTADDLTAGYRYDGRDLIDRVTDAAGRETHVRYFANREIEEIERPAARLASYQYDADNRLVARSKPGAPTTRDYGYAYGETATSEGDLTEGYPRTVSTDADALTTTTEHNRLGEPRYYRNKSGHTFEFRYDGLGRRTHSITPLDAAN
ncbi:MAG: DUF6531 domain-containing protein, partial [Opitutales bacterium]